MSLEDTTRVLWTAHLDVFEQDFDTAMAIWSVEDDVVGRLCADEQPLTRRRSQLSSSQVEFSQLSECSQRERPTRARKRRRTVVSESPSRDAPPPPLQCLPSFSQPTQDLTATQPLSMDSATQIIATYEGDFQDDDTQVYSNAREDCGLTVQHGEDVKVLRTPTIDRRARETKSANEASPFSQAYVVRESPVDCTPKRGWVDNILTRSADDTAVICSEFTTGSGTAVMVSRKRLREVEADWMSDQGAGAASMSSHDEQDRQGDTIPTSKQCVQDNSIVIDPTKRLSYSAIDDDWRLPSTGVHHAASGRGNRFDQESPHTNEMLHDGEAPIDDITMGGAQQVEPKPVATLDCFGPRDKVRHGFAQAGTYSKPDQMLFAAHEANGFGKAMTAFRTGNGRQVAVSRERLSEYAKAVFEDHGSEQPVNEENSVESDRSPASSFRPSVPFNQATPSPSQKNTNLITPGFGFQTASGRNVVISEKRLKEIEEHLFGDDRLWPGTDRNECVHPAARQPSTAPEASKPLQQSSVPVPTTLTTDEYAEVVSSGFQTGSGASINISREQLRRYELKALSEHDALRNDQDSSDPVSKCSDNASTTAILAGFTTGSGGRVTVSKERLRMYEKIFEDEECVESKDHVPSREAAPSPELLGGFRTARGQKLVVSEEKLREYARRLNEDDPDDETGGRFDRLLRDRQVSMTGDTTGEAASGFTSGSGRRTPISQEKLRYYEEKFALSEQLSADLKDTGYDSDDHETDKTMEEQHSGLSENAAIVLAGFTTGSGRSVSVSEETLREYQTKISQAYDNHNSSSLGESESAHLPDESRTVKKKPSEDCLPPETSAQDPQGRPPRHRHSVGSTNTQVAFRSTSRRHSLPPHAVAPNESNTPCVSSGVIQRLAIAHQRNSRPPVLDDVSNIPRLRSRVSGLNSGGGKWKPPSRLQPSQSSGYSTPAKMNTTAPQSLSAKKGFRPPVPLKTPPSKALLTSKPTPPLKTSPAIKEPERAPLVPMHFREVMRISYRLLAADVDCDAGSFTSESRANHLRRITPEYAPNVTFSQHDGELLEEGNQNAVFAMIDLLNEMKERGYIGGETAVTNSWFRNQYRWSVWKLATMELQSPRFLFGRYLNKSQVMFEICKRYQRDIVLAQRSILKKILQRDANAASCMVLRIAAVLPFPVEEEKDIDIIPPPHWKLAVVLTDGWHGIYAVPDSHLAEAFWKHHKAKRLVGKKIVTWSSLLQNANDGLDPLECALATETQWANPLCAGKEDPSKWPYLKLQFNSTRPVRADARLGFEPVVRPALGRQSDVQYDFVMLKSVPMCTLEVGGGNVRSVRVFVARISPILHLQSKDFSIGPRILCEEQMPQYLQARQDQMRRQREADIGSEEESAPSIPLPVPFVKMEVECGHNQTSERKCYAVLTVWRPGDEMLSKIKEGGVYFISNVSVNWKVDYGHQGVFLRVGTTKGSTIEPCETSDGDDFIAPSRVCESVGGLIERYRQHIMTMPKEKKLYGDVCVVILRCEDTKSVDRQLDACFSTSTTHIFGTDTSGRLMSIRLHSTRVFRPSISSPAAIDVSSFRKSAPERLFTRGNKKLWTEGNVVCFSGLEVSHYDEKLGVLDCDLVESTQIVSLPSKKSYFFEAAKNLKQLVDCRDVTENEGNEMAVTIRNLKKYIQRTILHLDVEPSQDEHVEVDDSLHDAEADYLTQELQEQQSSDGSYWMSQAPLLHVQGIVAKILPLEPSDPFATIYEVVALIYVQVKCEEDDELTFRAIYVTKDTLDIVRNLINCRSSGLDLVSESGTISSQALRFEAHWETSERLLNSWKPWERDGGATFLLATAVTLGNDS